MNLLLKPIHCSCQKDHKYLKPLRKYIGKIALLECIYCILTGLNRIRSLVFPENFLKF